jgi:type III restriction system methylase
MSDLKMHTANLVAKNIEKLTALFPNCITETRNEQGKIIKGVDFDLLRQELSDVLVEGEQERYTLNWVGKKESILAANAPIAKTLRPCREESVNFDTTENLFIEGDNLDALKLLQENYLGKVKMIYIDPPYNTGKDFIYRDNFVENTDGFLIRSSQIDEEGNRLIANTESNGRFHSDWLSMMYSRLRLARNLLTDDGVIFISIDDSEQANLKRICDEIFGEKNFVACIIIDGTPKSDPYIVSTAHEYCLVYVRNFEIAKLTNFGVKNPIYEELLDLFSKFIHLGAEKVEAELKLFYKNNSLEDDNIANYKFCDELGIFRTGPIDDPQSSGANDERINPKTGKPCKIPTRGWSCNLETWEEWKKNNLIYFPDTDDVLPAKKTYIAEDRLDVLRAYFKYQTRKDTDNLKKMFGTKTTVFSNPKPLDLIKLFLSICQDEEFTVLDFFAGSATTAHAVFELNSQQKNKKIRFISVQIPEELSENNATSKKQKKIIQTAIEFLESQKKSINIAEISKERIRRAGSQILQNLDEDKPLDVGFRALKIDSSNMKDIYYQPEQYDKSMLDQMVSHIKEDRTAEDLLFQVMLDWGVELSLPIERKTIDGSEVYFVAGNTLVACFDKFTMNVVDEIAKVKPLRVVSTELAIMHDQDKTNIKERFKQLSPDTEVKFL